MTTDILQSTLSPTQERGESKVSTTIVHDELIDAEGRKAFVKITYDFTGDVVVGLDFKVLGEISIPEGWLKEMIQEIVERRNGQTLIFNV